MTISKKITPAIDQGQSPFDNVVINEINQNHTEIVGRIEIGKLVFTSNKKSFELEAIFKAIEIGLTSSWYLSLSPRSHNNYFFILKKFLPWINTYTFNPENRFNVLKSYESERAATMKSDSTGFRQIVNLLKKSLERGLFEPKELRFIVNLVRTSKPLPAQERTSYTLTRHFSSMPWLKEYLGDSWFLMESPKRLIKSFLIPISVLLEALITARLNTKNYKFDAINPRTKKIYQGNNYWIIHNKKLLLETLATDNKELLHILLNDFVSPEKHDFFKSYFSKCTSLQDIDIKQTFLNRKCFLKPNLFNPDTASGPSIIEQQLFGWLCAAQTIAPSSISELTKENFVIEYGPRGNLAYMQCFYNKGRSTDARKETRLLGINDIESNAMRLYIEEYGVSDKFLCPDIPRIVSYNFSSFGNILSRCLRLFQVPHIRKKIEQQYQKYDAEPIFLKIIETMSESIENSYPEWASQKKAQGLPNTYDKYLLSIKKFTPITLFGLSHVKTSAVHAQSDKYRSGDLLNYNSHTAETEKYSYLTDSNKDWVNQYGRITRMVMREVEKTHIELDFNEVINTARKKTVCKVVDADTNEPLDSSVSETLVVIDSTETVVMFLHYIDQAKKKFRELLNKNQEFVERVLLPNVEWMSYLLIQKLSPNKVIEGKREFKAIRPILPTLFDAQLDFTL